MKKILILFCAFMNLHILYANSIIETRTLDGVEYKLIETIAEVTYARDTDENIVGKDIFFYKNNGDIALSDITQKELEPYSIKEKIKIYYIEKSNEPKAQLFRVYLHKNDVQWQGSYVSKEVINNNFDSSKIKTSPIHSTSGVQLKLVSDGNNIYKFVGNYGLMPYFLFAFIGLVILLFLRNGNLGGVVIGIFMAMIVYFMIFGMSESEKSVFDLNNKEFYKGETIADARNFGNNYATFNNIYGLQILKDIEFTEIGTGATRRKQYYDVYELNLVLKNNRRINILCHSNLEQLLIDANKLSSLLNIPLMNEINK